MEQDNAIERPSGLVTSPRAVRAKRRGWRLAASFAVMVVAPTVLGGWYYGKVASDRYAAGASFVVRGVEAASGVDLFSSFTGMPSAGSTTSDSYIIRRYLESPDLLRALDDMLSLREHFAEETIDPVSRLAQNSTLEEFVEYWSRRIQTSYDSTTGIVSYEVQAFDPDTAIVVADAVLDAATQLVNELSEKARRDSVQFATREVERAEERLYAAQMALRRFREEQGAFDPVINAQLDAELIATLEAQLADLQAQVVVLAEAVGPAAPRLTQLKRQVEALADQIAQRRAAIGGEGGGAATANMLAEFEDLQIEQTFAQQRYASALTSLEAARMEADRQQRYLAIFARPFRPEEAVYPERLRNTLLIFGGAFVIWLISTLIALAVRDHVR